MLTIMPHSGKDSPFHFNAGYKLPGIPLLESEEFKYFRKRLNRTQKQIAELLGTSLKAIHSYEQGWRNVPAHVERQMFFLISRLKENRKIRKTVLAVQKMFP